MSRVWLSRPGPPWITAGQCPGGIVFAVYAVPTERHLLTRKLSSLEHAEQLAERDADSTTGQLAPDEEGVCLVAWNGDSGERLSLADFQKAWQ